MGNRRLGRKRLFTVNKQGQSLTTANQAGSAAKNMVVSQTIQRQGHEVITEIAVDLGTSKGTIVVGSDTNPGGIGIFPIGESGLTGSYLAKLTAAENGYIIGADMICTEVPVGGTADIDLFVSSESTGSHAELSQPPFLNALVQADEDWQLGDFKSYVSGAFGVAFGGKAPASGNLPDHQVGGDYLYLGHGSSNYESGAAQAAGTYTAGKYVIRLYGIVEPDSI
jgi:hypothetical protein